MMHYLFLLPFLPGIRSLITRHSTSDLVIYFSGFCLVLILIIFSNHKPLLTMEESRLSLYLNHRRTVAYLPYKEISAYRKLSSDRIRILSPNHHPVNLYIGRKDMNHLVDKLQEMNIAMQ